jgi:hypothetical protein
MRDADQLWSTAIHEASHGAVAVALGAATRAGPISIVGGRSFHGISFVGEPAKFAKQDIEAASGVPWVLWPTRLRRNLETRVMVCLAGFAGQDMLAGRGAAPPLPAAPQRVTLPPREDATLTRAVAQDETQTDIQQAYTLMRAIHLDDDKLQTRHLGFLAAQVDALLAAEAGRIVKLAEALYEARTLPAARWKQLLAA